MATIAANQARAVFTSMIVDAYRQMPQPMGFLRSFFKDSEQTTRYVSIQVERNAELIAVDVQRGTQGNRNTFGQSTEKVFEPPYFREYYDMTEIDLYDRLFGSTAIDASVMAQLVESNAVRVAQLRNKIERRYELQCAQVMETGIVTTADGNIDFKRQGGSKVDLGSGNYYASSGVNPYTSLEAGCNWIRQNGKAQGGVFHLIFGSTAFQDFLNNQVVKDRSNLKVWLLDNIQPAQRNSTGGVLHGYIDIGSYRAYIWTYPEFYDLSGSSTPYVNPKIVNIIPETPRFTMAYAAVPMLLKAGVSAENMELPMQAKKGAYVFGDYVDEKNSAHIFDVKSAGLALPVAVDTIYTLQVVA